MAELSLGASGNVFIDAGQIVRVSTSGVATVVMQYGGPAGTDTITANTRDYGPYGVPAKIRITATSGTVTYRELDETPTFTPAQVQGLQGLVSDDGIAAPATNLAAAVGSAGVLTGAYYYTQTFVTALGETAPWPGTATVVNPSLQRVNLSSIPTGPDGVIARRIYRTPAVSGTVDVKDYRYVGEISDNTTTTYTDNLADGSLGAPVKWAATNRRRFRDASGVEFAGFSDQSTALGQGTFSSNTGYASTAIGYEALHENTTGRRNVAVGTYALTKLTTGYQNTSLGVHSGNNLTTGFSCTFVGFNAGFNSTAAEENTAVGLDALGSQTQLPARRNTAIGARTMASINGAWTACTALGYAAGKYMDASYQLSLDCGIDRSTTAGNKNVSLIFGQGTVASPQTQYLYFNAAVRLGWDAPTVSQLPAPSATLRGCHAYVTDASVTYASANLGSTVAGGGANTVPVFCNGTNWVIG